MKNRGRGEGSIESHEPPLDPATSPLQHAERNPHTLKGRIQLKLCYLHGVPLHQSEMIDTNDLHSGKSVTIRESNHASGIFKEHYA